MSWCYPGLLQLHCQGSTERLSPWWRRGKSPVFPQVQPCTELSTSQNHSICQSGTSLGMPLFRARTLLTTSACESRGKFRSGQFAQTERLRVLSEVLSWCNPGLLQLHRQGWRSRTSINPPSTISLLHIQNLAQNSAAEKLRGEELLSRSGLDLSHCNT